MATTQTHLQKFLASQKKAYSDMTDKQKEKYVEGRRKAELADGIADELVQIVALRDRKTKEILAPRVTENKDGVSKTISFRIRRANFLQVDGEVVPASSVPKGDEGKAFRQEHDVKQVFTTASAYVKNEHEGLINFYSSVKPGVYYNLKHLVNKETERGISVYNMFEAKPLNARHQKQAEEKAQAEEMPF